MRHCPPWHRTHLAQILIPIQTDLFWRRWAHQPFFLSHRCARVVPFHTYLVSPPTSSSSWRAGRASRVLPHDVGQYTRASGGVTPPSGSAPSVRRPHLRNSESAPVPCSDHHFYFGQESRAARRARGPDPRRARCSVSRNLVYRILVLPSLRLVQPYPAAEPVCALLAPVSSDSGRRLSGTTMRSPPCGSSAARAHHLPHIDYHRPAAGPAVAFTAADHRCLRSPVARRGEGGLVTVLVPPPRDGVAPCWSRPCLCCCLSVGVPVTLGRCCHGSRRPCTSVGPADHTSSAGRRDTRVRSRSGVSPCQRLAWSAASQDHVRTVSTWRRRSCRCLFPSLRLGLSHPSGSRHPTTPHVPAASGRSWVARSIVPDPHDISRHRVPCGIHFRYP